MPVYLYAGDGAKTGHFEAEVQPAQPRKRREDGWWPTEVFRHVVYNANLEGASASAALLMCSESTSMLRGNRVAEVAGRRSGGSPC